MYELNHTYATGSIQIRRAMDAHKEWIEERLGLRVSDAAIIETDLSFCEAAIPRLIGYSDSQAPVATAIARLAERLQSVDVSPSSFPIIRLTRERAVDFERSRFAAQSAESAAYSMNSYDGPLLLRVRDLPVPIVSLAVRFHDGPNSSVETEQNIVVMSREGVQPFISLLKTLMASDGKARLQVGQGEARIVTQCGWDQLILDPNIVSLLKDDFDSFFEREAWFRKMRLPFRRGYLLHGLPGNGKSSAIRAMMTSRGLTAYTIRFFDEEIDDGDLEYLFILAAKEAPAIVLLEDIDRIFPRTGHSKTKLSLQQLLNCLDGVASSEGVITIASANDPTALDPAILRRPGRFDRVIAFGNPTPELRLQYFLKMLPSLASVNLDEAVDESEGFSFAQLREAFIMAAQADFLSDREITREDLLTSIWSLRGTTLFSNMKTSAGYGAPSTEKRRRRELGPSRSTSSVS
jgi:hypothetical protein